MKMMEKKLIPCRTDRTNKNGGGFVSSKAMVLIDLYCNVSSTITSRYWKGIEGSSSMAIIEVSDE